MQSKQSVEKLLIICIVILLITNIALFFRVVQLEKNVIEVLSPFQIPKGLSIGSSAPDFTLKDLSDKQITLRDYLGQKVLLVFFSTSCPACKEFWPDLKTFSQTNSDLKILLITQGSIEEIKLFMDEGITNMVVLQSDPTVEQQFKIPGTPFIYLLSSEQEVEFAGFSDELQTVQSHLKPTE